MDIVAGLGNDFILLDSVHPSHEKIRKMCDRHFGIGADGVIVLDRLQPQQKSSGQPTEEASLKFTIYNSDGSETQICGNGLRCFIKYAELKGLLQKNRDSLICIKTMKRNMLCRFEQDDRVSVNMGRPSFELSDLPANINHQIQENAGMVTTILQTPFLQEIKELVVSCIAMPNPHCVILLAQNSNMGDLCRINLDAFLALQKSSYFPKGVNIEFVEVESKDTVRVRVLERGVGETYACGSGACAVAVATHQLGLTGPNVCVKFKQGELDIRIQETGQVLMTGTAEYVFSGQYSLGKNS